jgi:hypothetical protein
MKITSQHTGRPVRITLLALALATLVSACGGGGGNPGAVGGNPSNPVPVPTPVPATPTVAVSFTNSTGGASNALTGATPLTARATVRDAAGNAVQNALVTFATDNTLAVFSPSAGTALTDASGVASVTLRAASLAAGGAGKVTASTTVAGATVASEANYSVGATALTFGALGATPASIQAYGSTVLSVDVFAAGVRYTDQQVNVNFSSACVTAGKATLAPTVATNNGTAQAVYRDRGCANNDLITVSADGVTRSVSTPLAIAAPAAASVQFASAAPTDKSIVIKGQGGIARTETATLKFRVVDIFGLALAGKQVVFSTTSPDVTLNKLADSTDQNGEVITTVNSGSVPTSFRVQATLPGTAANGQPDISTMSDSIVVTTGLPVQRAFSLSAGTFNVEGWNHDSTPDTPATTIQVLLADAFGNPVPDGTPVVFQTNMGSVGSASKGGCTTVNGGCTVDFRTQNPRLPQPNTPSTPCNTGTAPGVTPDSTRPGLATVCASSTDGVNTVFSKISLFFSGGSAVNVLMDGTGSPLPTNGLTTDLGGVPSGSSKVFRLQLNDVNLNPLPAGTKVEIAAAVNATVTALPAVVQNIFPHSDGADDISGNTVSGAQGSYHTITASNSLATPCVPSIATFSVTLTTPANVSTSFPFKLAFTCP